MATRAEWVKGRTGECVTQMAYARRGLITEEMRWVAERESVDPERLRAELADGRLIIPANIRHTSLEPIGIGLAVRCKINANLGNSAVTSNIDEELEKLRLAVRYGADTAMDLSTGGHLREIRAAIIEASPVPIGTVPIYEALQSVTSLEALTVDRMF